MAKKVKVLPERLTNLIAAGEVVERPASVVKELVENAIDAEADRIEVTCERSGKRLIRVMDNGYGMDYDDALTCLERHATSKIESEEDLQAINTLGFRGEALPSIASVSDMTLCTRPASEQAATKIVIRAGVIQQVTKAGSPAGTIIEVRNLFSNLPARAKFLRSDQTELTHIIQTVTRQAVPRPGVSFILIHEGRPLLNFPKTGNIRERLFQVLGKDQIEGMIHIGGEREGVKIEGYVSDTGLHRSNLLGQYLYVNRRFIKSPVIQKAIHDAYARLLPRQAYPLFCILTDIDPQRVDFNVHPAKLEIKFDDPSKVVDLVTSLIKDSVGGPRVWQGLTVTPKKGFQLHREPRGEPPPEIRREENKGAVFSPQQRPLPLIREDLLQEKGKGASMRAAYIPQRPAERMHNKKDQGKSIPMDQGKSLPVDQGEAFPIPIDKGKFFSVDKGDPSPPDKQAAEAHSALKPLGPCIQIDNSYILYEAEGGLVIIDQHAAHERVNFEKVRSSLEGKRPHTQTLLTHPLITVSPEEEAFMERVLPILEEMGFSLDAFGPRTYILRAVPAYLTTDPNSILQGVIQDLLDDRQPLKKKEDLIHKVASSIACHLSVKAHQPLKEEEIHGLINDLCAAEEPYACPHGRPTFFRIGIRDLEKNFGR